MDPPPYNRSTHHETYLTDVFKLVQLGRHCTAPILTPVHVQNFSLCRPCCRQAGGWHSTEMPSCFSFDFWSEFAILLGGGWSLSWKDKVFCTFNVVCAQKDTRKHSSRMRTTRMTTVCASGTRCQYWWGWALKWTSLNRSPVMAIRCH